MAARIKSLDLSEKEFTAQVLDLAKLHNWRSAHFRPGKTNRLDANGKPVWKTAVQGDGKGFPDLVLIKGIWIVAAELKVGKNKVELAQAEWLTAFAEAGAFVFVWRPEHWDAIQLILANGPLGSRWLEWGK